MKRILITFLALIISAPSFANPLLMMGVSGDGLNKTIGFITALQTGANSQSFSFSSVNIGDFTNATYIVSVATSNVNNVETLSFSSGTAARISCAKNGVNSNICFWSVVGVSNSTVNVSVTTSIVSGGTIVGIWKITNLSSSTPIDTKTYTGGGATQSLNMTGSGSFFLGAATAYSGGSAIAASWNNSTVDYAVTPLIYATGSSANYSGPFTVSLTYGASPSTSALIGIVLQ